MSTKSNPHKGHRTRMIDRLLDNGIESMTQHEMLEMILYKCNETKNTNEIAHNLLNKFGNSIFKVCNATMEELTSVKDVGPATAKYLKLFPAFLTVYSNSRFEKNHCFNKIEEIGEYCVSLYNHETNEVFYVLCFDINHRFIKAIKVSEGKPNEVHVDARKMLSLVLNTAATEVVLCHNHPGGTLEPSDQDVYVTTGIKRKLEAVGVNLVCHVIVANGKYVTFHC